MKLFNDELIRFNKTLSLVSSSTLVKIDRVHVADSILGWQIIKKDFKGSQLFDIGSGNGFPGIVIGLMEPGLQLTLVESDIRKAEYLKHTVDVCKLKNVKVVTQRLNTFRHGSVTTSVLRGFANIPKALLGFRKLVPKHGQIYHFKGPEWSTEVAALPQQLCSMWNNSYIGDYSIPESKIVHTIVRSDLI